MPLNQPEPQISRMTQTMTHGVSDARISDGVGRVAGALDTGGIVTAEASCVRSAGDSQTLGGCQIRRKPIRQPIEISDAPISTIHGLMKLEIRYCGTAKDT